MKCDLLPLACPAYPKFGTHFCYYLYQMHTKHLSALGFPATQHSRDAHCSTVCLNGDHKPPGTKCGCFSSQGAMGWATRQKSEHLRVLPLRRQCQANEMSWWVNGLVSNPKTSVWCLGPTWWRELTPTSCPVISPCTPQTMSILPNRT